MKLINKKKKANFFSFLSLLLTVMSNHDGCGVAFKLQ